MKSHATQQAGRNASPMAAQEGGMKESWKPQLHRGSLLLPSAPWVWLHRMAPKGTRLPALVHVAPVLPVDPLAAVPILFLET